MNEAVRLGSDRVSIDRTTFDRIVAVLRFAAASTDHLDLVRASERAALMLFEIEATVEGGAQ